MFFVFDENRCKAEGMTKEQIINAIAEATGVTPQSIDDGFISTIVETNRNKSMHIWYGTQAEFNALASPDPNTTLYIVVDDKTLEDMQALYDELAGIVASISGDTGWQDITRNTGGYNPQDVVIGKYRIQGKTAFVSIKYSATTFSVSGSTDVFSLPILLDIHSGDNYIPVTIAPSVYPVEMEAAYAQLSTVNGKTQITVYSDAYEIDSADVYISFSYPVA